MTKKVEDDVEEEDVGQDNEDIGEEVNEWEEEELLILGANFLMTIAAVVGIFRCVYGGMFNAFVVTFHEG